MNICSDVYLLKELLHDRTKTLIWMHKELCVCNLAAVTGASELSISNHLRLLRQEKPVKYRREGKVLFIYWQMNMLKKYSV